MSYYKPSLPDIPNASTNAEAIDAVNLLLARLRDSGVLKTPTSPLLTTGLEGWFEARRLNLANGAAVSQYTDLSGLNRHILQATSGNMPVFSTTGGPNGTPTVVVGSGQWMASAGFTTIPQPLTLYMVASIDSIGTMHLFDSVGTSSQRCDVYYTNDLNLQLYSGSGYVTILNQTPPTSTLVPAKKHHIFRIVVNGASSTCYRNGVPSGITGNPGTNGLDGFTLGSYVGGAGGGLFNGTISALLVYSVVHSDYEAGLIEGYLNSFGFNESLPQIVCDGDSLTAGYTLTTPATESYPGQLQSLLSPSSYDVYNVGLSGHTINSQSTGGSDIKMIDSAPHAVDVLYRRSRSRNVCIIWGGANDLLGFNPSPHDTVANLETNISAYCAARRSVGFKVIVVSLPPSSYAGTSVDYETNRLAYNVWLRANWSSFADALADFGGDPYYGNVSNTGTTTNDGLHFTVTAYTVLVKKYIIPALNSFR